MIGQTGVTVLASGPTMIAQSSDLDIKGGIPGAFMTKRFDTDKA